MPLYFSGRHPAIIIAVGGCIVFRAPGNKLEAVTKIQAGAQSMQHATLVRKTIPDSTRWVILLASPWR